MQRKKKPHPQGHPQCSSRYNLVAKRAGHQKGNRMAQKQRVKMGVVAPSLLFLSALNLPHLLEHLLKDFEELISAQVVDLILVAAVYRQLNSKAVGSPKHVVLDQ